MGAIKNLLSELARRFDESVLSEVREAFRSTYEDEDTVPMAYWNDENL
jgi:hypothetical protein